MKTARFLLLLSLVLSVPVEAQRVCRRAIVTRCEAPDFNPASERSQDDYAGLFTIGTLFGASVGEDPSTYKIENNVVKYQRRSSSMELSVLALPSINVLGAPGKSLSAIVPIGAVPSGEWGAGLGFSGGFNIRQSWELGVAAAVVRGTITELTAEQKTSLANRSPLPAGASTDLQQKPVMFFAFGLYVAPLRKEK